MRKSPRTVRALILVDTDDDQIEILVTARVVPPEYDPPTGFVVDVLDAHYHDGADVGDEVFRLVEDAVNGNPEPLITEWFEEVARDADDAAEMRRYTSREMTE